MEKNYKLKDSVLEINTFIKEEELKDLNEFINENIDSIKTVKLKTMESINTLSIYSYLKSLKETYENIVVILDKKSNVKNLNQLEIVNF